MKQKYKYIGDEWNNENIKEGFPYEYLAISIVSGG